MSDSLVRVSRRAEWGAHRPVPGARRYIAETARAANHDRRDGISTSLSTARALAAAPIRTGPRPESIGGPAIAVPHPTGTHRRPPFASLPTIFKHSLTLFSKSFSSFPRGGLGPGPPLRTLLQTTIRTARPSDFQAGLIPVRSPLLRESLYMFTGRSAFAGFDNDPSAGSPTETLLRLLLPLNDKVQWNSRDVAGGEPPTSPRS
ncbi:hypothetical protein L1887_59277 [Cichorium endivia]|nr:hypothetical protein L1887_59277 [Cichorium endivia]